MSPEELLDAANNRRSVTGMHAHRDKPTPAAFVVSMQFRVVMRMLPRLKLYEPKAKRQFHEAVRNQEANND